MDRILAAPGEGGAWCGDPELIDAHWQNDAPVPPMPRDVILMGDLNSNVETPVYEMFVGPKSMEGGRVQTIDGFVDPWVWLGNEETSGRTSHFSEDRIDHILIGSSLRHRIRAMHIDEKARGSDHLPVWVELGEQDRDR
jgi:endonuclease/exonuclease/phosphatase family metal-dependent hydrolase